MPQEPIVAEDSFSKCLAEHHQQKKKQYLVMFVGSLHDCKCL